MRYDGSDLPIEGGRPSRFRSEEAHFRCLAPGASLASGGASHIQLRSAREMKPFAATMTWSRTVMPQSSATSRRCAVNRDPVGREKDPRTGDCGRLFPDRLCGTLQDRLVKELRLRGISSTDAGNAFLPEYMADFNGRFATRTRSTDRGCRTYHRGNRTSLPGAAKRHGVSLSLKSEQAPLPRLAVAAGRHPTVVPARHSWERTMPLGSRSWDIDDLLSHSEWIQSLGTPTRPVGGRCG